MDEDLELLELAVQIADSMASEPQYDGNPDLIAEAAWAEAKIQYAFQKERESWSR